MYCTAILTYGLMAGGRMADNGLMFFSLDVDPISPAYSSCNELRGNVSRAQVLALAGTLTPSSVSRRK